MKWKSFLSFDFLLSFQDREAYFQKIIEDKRPFKETFTLYLFMSLFSFLFGVVMGSYHSFLQSLIAGIKVTFLFSMVLLICFPAFFIIQFILGSKLKLRQMISIILSGFLMITTIMISFAPIGVFFVITGSNYYFLQLLYISIFLFSGFFGMKMITDALQYSCEKKNVYPKTGVVVFRIWIVIFAFVGIQLAWNLRPFLGDREEPFKLFRKYEGNFYTAVIYSVRQLVNPVEKYTDMQKAAENYNTPKLEGNNLLEELNKINTAEQDSTVQNEEAKVDSTMNSYKKEE